jgi:Spy/CpxP family protein refolding chaperone
VTGRKRIQLGVVALAACLGGAALTVGAGAVAAFEQKATQAPQVQTPPATSPTPSPAQGRGAMDGRGGPGRGGPGGGDVFHEWEWWKDDTAKRELGLTDKVAADIDRFYQIRLRAVTPFIEEWRKQRDNLQQMTLERSVDESMYAVQVAHLESLTSKLRESRTTMLYHIYRLLTPEQYKKLAEVRDRHFQRGRSGH